MLKHDQSSICHDFRSSDNISQPDLSDKLNEAYAKFYNPFKLLAMQVVVCPSEGQTTYATYMLSYEE